MPQRQLNLFLKDLIIQNALAEGLFFEKETKPTHYSTHFLSNAKLQNGLTQTRVYKRLLMEHTPLHLVSLLSVCCQHS